MNAKIKSLGFVVVIFVAWSVIYYEIVIGTASKKRDELADLNRIRHQIVTLHDEDEIVKLLEIADTKYASIEEYGVNLYNSFVVVQVLCFMNLTFKMQDLSTLLFVKIMGKFMVYPSLHHLTNDCLAISSCFIIRWFQVDI